MSLRHKLVLLLCGLALVAVGLSVTVAWGEVRQAAREAADERLARAVQQLSGLVQASAEVRGRLLEEVGTRPALRAAVRGASVDSAAVLEALDELRTPADSGLAIHLVDRGGTPVFVDLLLGTSLSGSPPPLDTVPTVGGVRSEDGEVRYWSTSPVRARDGEIVGWVVQERRVGTGGAAARLQDLIGAGSRIVFWIPGEELAVTLAGEPLPPPPAGVPADSLLAYQRGGAGVLARAAAVPGAPWVVLVETPQAAVGARSEQFLRRMSVLALLLVLGTVLVAYAVGRRLTGPIEKLAEASEAMAGGYSGEAATVRGGDELHRLARSFEEMAARVIVSRAELEERLTEEQALARRLEETSARAEEARAEAQRANRAKSEFLATMSHEVRTPINAILGYCDLLDLEIPDPLTEQQREKVERIRRSSRVLEGLVDDVLDFAKLDSGRLRVQPTTAPVREAVLGASAVVEPQAARASLPIEIHVDPELQFLGDPRRVEQILVNLLTNAVKFTKEGRVEVRAAAGNGGPAGSAGRGLDTDGDGWVRIDVEDTGPGIPEEQRERMFAPFVQGESGFTRPHGGTGLGLSISRELARMMGGELTVTSPATGGSCFSLWLPAPPGDRTAPPARGSAG